MKIDLHITGANLDADETREVYRARIILGQYKWLDLRQREDGTVEIYTSGDIELRCVASNRIDITTTQ